jgi:predicted AlkP superfamily pyrophosphatase or phosphodiesterase
VRAIRINAQTAVAASAVGLVTLLSGAAPQPTAVRAGAVSDHVVVISLDGMRPDALEKFGASTIQRLMREGSRAQLALTITPSKTLPSHTSMLTGVPPEVHGVTWNEDQTDEHGVVDVATVFEVAKNSGYTTAAFFSKSKFHHLQKPGTLDYTQAPSGRDMWMAPQTVTDVATYLKHERPNLLFVHLAETDYAGHAVGWMSFAYKWAVKRMDDGVKKILDAADGAYGVGNYTVIVTADHGGHGRGHGSEKWEDMNIPWLVWGEGVSGGSQVEQVRTMDTAATVLWLLGVAEPTTWTGRAVAGAFTNAANLAASAAVGVMGGSE